MGQKFRRETIPRGWDLADAVADGWTADSLAVASQEPDFLEVAPRPLITDDKGRTIFRMAKAGVEKWVVKYDSRGQIKEEYWKLICGPLELIAETRDEEGNDWGKLFKFTDPDGKSVEWVMPNDFLAGDGVACREALLNRGLMVMTGRLDRDYLQEYLSKVTTPQRARCVDRLGWHDRCYVTGSVRLGQNTDQRTVFRGSSQSKVGRTAGTLAGWQENVAKYAVGNSRLTFAISAAFAGPLILPTRSESGGFHFVGNSSVGKTTALALAGSVWGGGGTGGYLRSWRATSNGLEGVAADHCDGLLCLDEMSQVRAQEAGACAYMLANGVGKTRASRTGATRPAPEWRLMLLSTGEVGLADKVSEDSRGAPGTTGQQVRIIDLDADAGSGFGIFQNLTNTAMQTI